MQASAGVVTFLFTDIEGSTRLWEQQPERMRPALARHDAIARAAVQGHRGTVVKTAGDGIHATFDDPLDAISATLELQQALDDPAATGGIAFRVRCGVHVGVDEHRDNDFFGPAVNRAARIMSVAHGGQVLLSEAVSILVRDRLPSGVTLRDLGLVRLRDLASPERVYQVIHPQLRQQFPALRLLETTPNNLPQQLTSFVGREQELAEIRKMLPGNRLVTLLGVGGIGKTRLSLQVAADMLDDFPDGVWFVELAPLTDPQLVPQAVASVLGVKEEAGRPVIEALEKHVSDRQLLLILDNCEHLVEACGDLVKRLLQFGSRLKILTSSRENLHVVGENTYPVPALGVPDPAGTIMPEALSRYESVRLLVDRAVAAQPAFHVTEQNASAIAEICRRLDGIPLAIELAAARLRGLSVDNIAARLNDCFRLLTKGSRNAIPRQQTLRALIDWSYDLLSDKERILFCRLAVFAGGWTLEGAEGVAIGGALDRASVLDLLVDLVDKSLVVVEAEGARYSLLETVRQYAEERLRESGEIKDVRERHLDFYVALAEKAGAGITGPEQADWLRQLDLDLENLLSAHAWCLAVSDAAESDYRLVHAIKLYWFMRGLLDLGHRVTVEAVSIPALQPHSLGRCKALWVAGQICSYTGRYDEAQRYLYESLTIARHHGDRRMVAAVLNILALAALGQGDRAAAQFHSEEALDLAREVGNKREIAVASNALAQLDRLEGKLDRAKPLYEEVVALAHELHDREFVAIGLLGLAMVAISRGSAGHARDLLREALTIAEETNSKPAGQSVLEVSAGLAALRKDWNRSARLYGAAEAQTLRTGIRRDPADEAFLQPLLTTAREALGELFARAETSGRELSSELAIADVRAWLSSKD
jgi:predicted ATPase/class 3 adenylate cyclase